MTRLTQYPLKPYQLQNDSWVNATHHETLTPGSHWGGATVWSVKDLRVNKAVAA